MILFVLELSEVSLLPLAALGVLIPFKVLKRIRIRLLWLHRKLLIYWRISIMLRFGSLRCIFHHLIAPTPSPKVLIFELSDITLDQGVQHGVDHLCALLTQNKRRMLELAQSPLGMWLVLNRTNLVKFWGYIVQQLSLHSILERRPRELNQMRR